MKPQIINECRDSCDLLAKKLTMKRTFKIYFVALLLLAGNNLRSQNINAPAANIEHLLCHKWVVDYAFMGNTKLDDPGEQKDLFFEFEKNGLFVMTMGGTKDSYTGNWKYDTSEKIIKLIFHGSVGFIVNSLSEDKLIMISGTKSNMPEDNMRVVYKKIRP